MDAVTARPPEREIYKALWARDDYREFSPGEHAAQTFLRQAKPRLGASVIDLGCGSGRGGLILAMPPPAGASMNVTLLDFADNCLDEIVRETLETSPEQLRFVEADLTVPHSVTSVTEYGFCCDVLEHIAEDKVSIVLHNCLMAAQHCFFQICTVDDSFGAVIGHPLHLTVKPFAWWLEQFQKLKCVVHWSKDDGHNALFYVTAWSGAQEVADVGMLNVGEEKIKEQVAINIAGGWDQVSPHETNNVEVMIVGGGPSLKNHIEDIKRLRAEGVKLVTLNGAYNWALEQGMKPSATIICDARDHNARFVKPVIDECKYLMCSQVHPSVLEGLPRDRTLLWHTSAEAIHDTLLAQYPVSYPIPGGSTVLLRAIPLLRMLGFTKFHLFGCDSCLSEEEAHHAYAQAENDRQTILPVVVTGGRIFQCNAWMISQAHEFIGLIQMLGDELELEVYGDGLLAYILREGAALADLQPDAEFALE